MLLRITPVPGTSTPEPEPFEQVTAAHIPSASITEMWVVEPSSEARCSLAASIAATRCSGPLVGPSRSSVSSEWAISVPPAEGRGLVRTSVPRKAAWTGSRSIAA